MASERSSQNPEAYTDSTPPVAAVGDEKGSAQPTETSMQVAEKQATEDVYPTGSKLGVIILALAIAVFCVALDSTVISTAIPRITDDFHVLQDVGWYGSAYLLTTAAFQLPYGKLFASFSIKIVFLGALAIFEIGSLVCATSPNSPALIVGRAIAGLGAAGLFTGALIIISHSCPIHKRPAYTGIVGATYGLGSVVGPLIGGAFTDKVTWRWCFYINLPLGGFSALIIIFLLKLKTPPNTGREKVGLLQTIWSLDPIGTLLFVPRIVCLLLALKWGGTTYSWNDGRIIALFIVFGVLLIIFVIVQIWMGEKATIPPRIASQRTIAFSSIFALFMGGEFIILTYFLPLWFQAIQGVDAWHSGIRLIPLILSLTIGIMLSGGLTTKFGSYMPFVYASLVLTSIGSGLITTLRPGSSSGKWIGYQVIFGFGCGLAFQVPQIAAPAVLPLKDVAQGVSITFFSQMLGGALFNSIGANVLDNKLVKYIGDLNILSVDPKVIVQLGATQLRSYVPAEFVRQTVEAYNHALVNVFQIAVIIACLSILGAIGMEWKSLHSSMVGNETQEPAEAEPQKEV